MAESVKIMALVKEARYIEDEESIIMVCECDKGPFYSQINAASFTFNNKDKHEEMRKTASLLIGKRINVVFDPDLDKRIQHGGIIR